MYVVTTKMKGIKEIQFLTARFNTLTGVNQPDWTSNREKAYVYDTAAEAEQASQHPALKEAICTVVHTGEMAKGAAD